MTDHRIERDSSLGSRTSQGKVIAWVGRGSHPERAELPEEAPFGLLIAPVDLGVAPEVEP